MTPRRRSGARPGRRWLRRLAVLSVVVPALGAVAGLAMLERLAIAPRQLGPYVERRASGHNPAIEASGRWVGRHLVALDRAAHEGGMPALNLGAQPVPANGVSAARVVLVSNVAELRGALAGAQPGDAITLLPGRYRIDAPLDARQPGRADAPIVVRAELPGSVRLEQEAVEGFRISAPYWRFENLGIHGVCHDDSDCEHAFHITGAAHHVAAVNNTVVDFNAHFKINGHNMVYPDHGLLESNTLTNTHVRATANPVTPIDVVGASDWVFRRNLISDFVKEGGNNVAFGAFVKGGGERNLFERNLVWCEHKLTGRPGQRIGLSLGGGGTDKQYCRVRGCIVEQQQSILRDNLVAACSDVGIYLNSAAQSSVVHNSVIDTAGIDVRYPGSSADLEGNLVDGPIRSRNGGIVRERDNLSAASFYAYLGYHPVRALYAVPQLEWHAAPARRETGGGAGPDLCGQPRPARPAYGAFERFTPCLAAPATSSNSAAN